MATSNPQRPPEDPNSVSRQLKFDRRYYFCNLLFTSVSHLSAFKRQFSYAFSVITYVGLPLIIVCIIKRCRNLRRLLNKINRKVLYKIVICAGVFRVGVNQGE